LLEYVPDGSEAAAFQSGWKRVLSSYRRIDSRCGHVRSVGAFVGAILGTGARLLRHYCVSRSAAGLVGGSLTFPFQAVTVRLQLVACNGYIQRVPATMGDGDGPCFAVHGLQYRRSGASAGRLMDVSRQRCLSITYADALVAVAATVFPANATS